MQSKMNILFLSAVVTLTASAMAQMAPDLNFMGGPGMPAWQAKGGMTMRIDSMDAAPVKGAPFCATVVTEHTQSLADGNRIHTTDSSMLCRDGEGRTRREAGLNLLGASPQASAPKLITITDPVAGVRYLLDTENKIAQKMPMMPEGGPEGPGPAHQKREVMIYQRTGGPGSDVMFNNVIVKKGGPDAPESEANKESIGDQTIEGIHTVGTRMTTTIPAGKMGNEKPITVTSERWYSPELKATIMTKHNDPWSGELKTEFKNVSNGEPDASLFAVPADYKVVDDKDGPIRIKIHAPGPP